MSATPSGSPTHPLADLSESQRNLRATPSLVTPAKGHSNQDYDLEIQSTIKTSKSHRTMTIHTDEEAAPESHHESYPVSSGSSTTQTQQFDDAPNFDAEEQFDMNGVPSSPFETTVPIDLRVPVDASPEEPSSPSPLKSQGHQTPPQDDDEDSVIYHDVDEHEEGMSTIYHGVNDEHPNADETEFTIDVGDLSTFSAVPNADMTLFSRLQASPTKTGGDWSPNKLLNTPGTARRSPRKDYFDDEATPRRPNAEVDLLNFTGQTNIFIPPPSAPRTSRRSPSGRGAFPVRVSPTKSQAQLERERAQQPSRPPFADFRPTTSVPETPSRRNNLLDLDIEPLPTPRSVPTITPRELESLRSELSSQISALKATLSGKEAEVTALKKAITDAEVRCGSALEEVRNETAKVEGLEQERETWRSSQMEMEGMLRDVRQEILIRTRDAEKADGKVDEMEKKLGDWEGRNRELEAQVETLRRRVAAAATAAAADSNNGADVGDVTMKLLDVDAAVKEATERVARELHSLYKGKHETKVAALKKSYEARWEKRVKELEKSLKEAQDEVLALKTERDATISAPVMTQPDLETEKENTRLREESERLEADRRMLEARIEGLQSELDVTQSESNGVRSELEKQRAENGELVAAVDELLALQSETNAAAEQAAHAHTTYATSTLQSNLENLRGSIHRSAHPHSSIATAAATSTPRSTTKYSSPAKARPTSLHSGLKLPQPALRGTGIPSSAGESRIGKGPSASRIGGITRSTGLAEGIRMMGGGGPSGTGTGTGTGTGGR